MPGEWEQEGAAARPGFNPWGDIRGHGIPTGDLPTGRCNQGMGSWGGDTCEMFSGPGTAWGTQDSSRGRHPTPSPCCRTYPLAGLRDAWLKDLSGLRDSWPPGDGAGLCRAGPQGMSHTQGSLATEILANLFSLHQLLNINLTGNPYRPVTRHAMTSASTTT